MSIYCPSCGYPTGGGFCEACEDRDLAQNAIDDISPLQDEDYRQDEE